MSTHTISVISPSDLRAQRQVDALLAQAGLARDQRLEETLGLFDEAYELLATGSLLANTLRCVAVDPARKGEGLLAELLTALMERQYARGHTTVFLYTKPDSAGFFEDLGFSRIAEVPGLVVFMENKPDAFARYLKDLSRFLVPGQRTAAVVMNANPFTLGHRHLLARASKENDAVRCFVVSEDISLVPFSARLSLVKAGSAHLPNVTVHPSGSYIISSATFPSYFLKEERLITEAQARLDIEVFARIAGAMGIARRYIGEEPFSEITRIYNGVMQQYLPAHGIECVLIPRKAEGGAAISASEVRQRLHDGDVESIRPLVPETTYAYFLTEEGRETIRRIREAERVRHD